RAMLRAWDLRSELDSVIEVGRVDHVEPAQRFLRLGKRTVGRDGLAVADSDCRRCRGRAERFAGLVDAAITDLPRERVVRGELGPRGVPGRLELFLRVDQQQVAHGWSPLVFGRPADDPLPRRRTASSRIDTIACSAGMY